MSFKYSLNLQIPFENSKQSAIAQGSLAPDPILKPNEISVIYSINSKNPNILEVKFSGDSDRVIRVAANNVIENLKTIIECMDEFDGKKNIIFIQE
ncbi:hypothetical protein PACTADRAFT_3102 [Pachysolen tannophilus NRRL Y-2460]|uniref:EKC/KEOPS complex subunit PCC1 n=1 Tax=Pachysolen tannophilus NRRL Y-2460 TaxID=669874 RepID=A0A1E4TUF9_PACTA|nr:hypothetical protein PACTADRAFT_3102 [Pachysolen tannophilus NRRL Y-2460]